MLSSLTAGKYHTAGTRHTSHLICDCNRRLNWKEKKSSTKVSTADVALPKQYTQTTACPYFMLTSPPCSINTPIVDLGCVPAHPARGISSSWKPELDTVSSLTHLDGSQTAEPNLSLSSQS